MSKRVERYIIKLSDSKKKVLEDNTTELKDSSFLSYEDSLEEAISFFEGEIDYIENPENEFEEDDINSHILDQIQIRGWSTELQDQVFNFFMGHKGRLLPALEDTLDYLLDLSINNIPVKDSKRVTDATADEIIALINEAGAKGRSWGWLESKLPSEFINLHNNLNKVFPIQYSRNNKNARGVHLTKPKTLAQKIDWSWLPEYKELKTKIDDIYDKYEATTSLELRRKIEKAIEKEDSISKISLLKSDMENFRIYSNSIQELIRESNFVNISEYTYYDFIEKDFKFDKQVYLKALNKSWENKRYKQGQETSIIKSKGQEIYNKEAKVDPLTPEAEDYIRKIIKGDTKEFVKKREERYNSRILNNSKEDILEKWKRDRRELKNLLDKLKELLKKGTIKGMSYSAPHQNVIYKKGGGYNYRGEWVGYSSGNYELAKGYTKPEVSVRGVEYKEQKEFSEAIARAFVATSVSELRQALEDALEKIHLMPDDSEKITKVKQDIIDFLEKKRLEYYTRQELRKDMPKRFPDSKFKYEYSHKKVAGELVEFIKNINSDYDFEYYGNKLICNLKNIKGKQNFILADAENLIEQAEDYLLTEYRELYDERQLDIYLGDRTIVIEWFDEDKEEFGSENYKMVYLFPRLMPKDLRMSVKYNLEYLGKKVVDGEENFVLKGTKKGLEAYAKYYLDYELHPDYLYEEKDFAGRRNDSKV